MEVMPVGEQRDRQIHELIESTQPIARPWSTDIAAAMELWDEMKAVGCHKVLTSLADGSHVVFMQTRIDGKVARPVECKGDMVADAISGAYIKWKGGSDEQTRT